MYCDSKVNLTKCESSSTTWDTGDTYTTSAENSEMIKTIVDKSCATTQIQKHR